MASVNKAIIVGNLGRDPDCRYFNDGQTSVTSLSIATKRKFKNQSGELVEETEWHRIQLFGRLAEIAKQYLHKGSSCYIEGRHQTRKYTGKDGIERYTTEIIAESIQLLDRRLDGQQSTTQTAQAQPQQTYQAHDEEVPF